MSFFNKLMLLSGGFLLMSLIPLSGCTPSNASSQASSALISSSEKPNILILIADDLGTDKVGAYQEGDDVTRPQTPHIDALAKSGVRFKNAYAYPICSPTRASILTGRQAFRTGVGQAVAPKSGFTLRNYPEEVTLPKLLSLAKSGYRTAHFGKWHLGIQSNDANNHPMNTGFESSAGFYGNLKDYFSFTKLVNGQPKSVTQYATLDTQTDVVDYIKSASSDSPWLVWAAFHAPHSPFHEPPSDMFQSKITDKSNKTELYRAMVEALDTSIGEIMSQIPDNTVVFFIGDNGSPGAVTQLPFDRNKVKSTLFEGGVNIPMIVSGPIIPAQNEGKASSALVHVLDIFSTVSELAGVSPSDHLPKGHIVDSQSFSQALLDLSSSPRKTVSVEMFEPNGFDDYSLHLQTVRNQNFKLIKDQLNQTVSFYNLSQADDGLDGKDLCPCPENLSEIEKAEYDDLSNELDTMKIK